MRLEVTQLELGPYAENCYVARHPGAEEAVVVDPGWPGAAAEIRRVVGEGRLAGILVETLRVPGHTEEHLAYAADGCLFAGDVLFAGSVGRTDRPNGNWERLLDSIRTLVERFPPETVVYPGHGPATTLGRELAANPFLA